MTRTDGLSACAAMLLALAGAGTARAADDRCGMIARIAMPNVHVAQSVSMQPGDRIAGSTTTVATRLCRVVATISTRPTEAVGIEVWLPLAWNHRLEGLGSAGFGGSIDYPDLAQATMRGFAAASTDTGHHGAPFAKEGEILDWASDPVRLDDWGRNAIHVMTVAARRIVAAYYGDAVRHAYFNGCSTGGAEAMSEAEYFPADYDGIHAGSPGMAYSRLMQSFLWTAMPSAHDPAAALPDPALALLHAAVLHACASSKALPDDAFLTTPNTCRFDPAALACHSGQPAQDCLSPPQIEAARRIYQPVRDPRTKAEIYPGFAPGGEADPDRVPGRFTPTGWYMNQGPLAQAVASPLLGTTIFHQAGWRWSGFDFDGDSDRIARTLAPHIDSTSPDLRAFAARGGRLIITQGWADAFNAPTLPIEYQAQVRRTIADPDRVLRLFMVPGMGHCGGGPGPNRFGGPGQPPVPVVDAQHDVVAALVDWVEDGRPPQRLIATRGRRDASSHAPALQRPLCPHPMHAVYLGTGDPAASASFACRP